MQEGCLDLKHIVPTALKDSAPGYLGLHAVILLLLAECNHFLISKSRKEKQLCH